MNARFSRNASMKWTKMPQLCLSSCLSNIRETTGPRVKCEYTREIHVTSFHPNSFYYISISLTRSKLSRRLRVFKLHWRTRIDTRSFLERSCLEFSRQLAAWISLVCPDCSLVRNSYSVKPTSPRTNVSINSISCDYICKLKAIYSIIKLCDPYAGTRCFVHAKRKANRMQMMERCRNQRGKEFLTFCQPFDRLREK